MDRAQYTGNRPRETRISRAAKTQSYGPLPKGGGRAAERIVLVRSFCSSYASSKAVRSEKGILGRLMLAMVLCGLLASAVADLAFSANSAEVPRRSRPTSRDRRSSVA